MDKKNNILDDFNLKEEQDQERGIRIAIVGHGGDMESAMYALEQIKLEHQNIEVFSCSSIEEAKGLNVKAIIDGDELLKPDSNMDLLNSKLTTSQIKLTTTFDDVIDITRNDKDDWSHPEGTKQKKIRKGNNRKKKKRRKR